MELIHLAIAYLALGAIAALALLVLGLALLYIDARPPRRRP